MQLLFPSGLAYGVIQMDPRSMVTELGLDDRKTLTAVDELKPKKYLVYLEHPLDVPLPHSRWCRYSMSPIASSLRAEDRQNGLLQDMVVPIYPNTQHSSQKRPPVRPSGTFPASNCFHWIDTLTNVRVRRRPEGELFDDAQTVSLTGRQHVAIQMAFSDDYARADKLLSTEGPGDDSESSASGSSSSSKSSVRSIPPDALHDPKVRQACSPVDLALCPPSPSASSGDSEVPIPPQSDDSSRRGAVRRPATPDSDSSSGSDLDEDVRQSIAREISGLNLFGWEPDPTVPLIPLVDLWLDLDKHICDKDIPSPLDWQKEEDEIVS
ncbi:hypothetical protein GSI_04300 [Ganoderma sinense ZZ0214-1]|uniref:Uncharacterized protein n=1 Tax=Ganoderma sinense ZZ0214-1 TaxID=1077348 RepID=A0A2G8SIT9_9APHY|nr:hypothetical protein GSI_04300 [Ganoderma sinense ZZ0214-1]